MESWERYLIGEIRGEKVILVTMNAINCLVHIDDINYKIVIQKDGVFVANFDDLSKAISKNEDLKEYDLTQEFFIFEVCLMIFFYWLLLTH